MRSNVKKKSTLKQAKIEPAAHATADKTRIFLREQNFSFQEIHTGSGYRIPSVWGMLD